MADDRSTSSGDQPDQPDQPAWRRRTWRGRWLTAPPPPVRIALLLLLTLAVLAVTAWREPAPSLAQDQPPPSITQRIGLDRLEVEPGQAIPTGAGVLIGHVESGPGDAYMPNVQAPRFEGVTFHPRSGPGTTSGHASSTATILYGPRGLAPGVTDVHAFDSRHFMGEGVLKAGLPALPDPGPVHLFTHSWISDPPARFASEVLQRLDLMIDQAGVLVVAGVNNGAETPIPALLGSAYNAIAVGVANGRSSGGPTRVEGEGRSKPDLVAPGSLTSYATPTVAAVAARLLEFALREPDTAARRQPQVIKAALMAGAQRQGAWRPGENMALDPHLGAGMVQADVALRILAGGPTEGDGIEHRFGWAWVELAPGESRAWRMDAPGETGEAALMAVWHRRVRAGPMLHQGRAVWAMQPRLADLALTLERFDDQGQSEVVAVSHHPGDSVALIRRAQLSHGRYRVTLARRDALPEPWTVALAWRFDTPTP